MYPGLQAAIETLLPRSHRVVVRARGEGSDKPDISITTSDGAIVAHVEVKHQSTLRDAFRPNPVTGQHQIGRYRADGLPVILTDVINWYDVTTSDDTSRAAFAFTDEDAIGDAASEAQMRGLLHSVCGVRPRYGLDSAVQGIGGVIARINSADDQQLTSGWTIVRNGLGLTIDANTLDGSGVGEIVAFTLLSIATNLHPLAERGFVAAAQSEWTSESSGWDAGALPVAMGATLRLFRDEDRRLSGGLLGADGWVVIRSIAAWIGNANNADQWSRLSDLWDLYLHAHGRRRTLGSWQTPRGVADFQVDQVAAALRVLGYQGLLDPNVTVIDPCCGTGVYLDAVIGQAVRDGGSPEGFNAPAAGGGFPRLLGADISSTAIAAAHIRISATGALPSLHMTDTLATGSSGSILNLFDAIGAAGADPIVAAARSDYEEMQRWATRDDRRDPVLVVIGNPPYLRSGLNRQRYEHTGWWNDVFSGWRAGSGGQGGGVNDLFAAFWAWSMMLCRQPHPAITARQAADTLPAGSPLRPFGVVSFITNRTWIDGKTFGPMRSSVMAMRPLIDITDFGPGSRGGGAGRWSDQPFEIETGTAIVTLTFGAATETPRIRYRRGQWVNRAVSVGDSEVVQPRVWSRQRRSGGPVPICGPWVPGLSDGLVPGCGPINGVVTGNDAEWIRVSADREFAMRHAYRPLDNRWTPSTPPPKARRGSAVHPGQAPASAWWREDLLFNPHPSHRRNGGWYIIGQFDAVKPGPGLHATREVPNHHLFKGSEASQVVRVGPGTSVPSSHGDWARSFRLSGVDFWLYALAATHHLDFWTPETEFALQLAEKRVQPPLSDDPNVVAALVTLGVELVEVWSVDGISPVAITGRPGGWSFNGHSVAEAIRLHGRRVLKTWREGRPGEWDRRRAEEYGRTVAALLRLRAIADEVAEILG